MLGASASLLEGLDRSAGRTAVGAVAGAVFVAPAFRVVADRQELHLGTPARKAAGWSVFSSLPQPLIAVPAFLFVEHFSALLPAALGFAAGAMVGRELLPDAWNQRPHRAVVAHTAIAFVLMLALQLRLAA